MSHLYLKIHLNLMYPDEPEEPEVPDEPELPLVPDEPDVPLVPEEPSPISSKQTD